MGGRLDYVDDGAGMAGSHHAGSGSRACVVMGGSGGGMVVADLLAGALARAGVHALALGYHGIDGLRPTLRAVPLEGFATAARWLGERAGVDAGDVTLLGLSRGSEAAMLCGAWFDGVGRRVVGVVPGNVVAASWPPTAPPSPAWLLGGQPLPFVLRSGPDCDDPDAVIPAERVDDLLLVSAGRDEVWPSGPMADAIVARRAAHGLPTEHLHVAAAGHHLLDLTAPDGPWATILRFVQHRSGGESGR